MVKKNLWSLDQILESLNACGSNDIGSYGLLSNDRSHSGSKRRYSLTDVKPMETPPAFLPPNYGLDGLFPLIFPSGSISCQVVDSDNHTARSSHSLGGILTLGKKRKSLAEMSNKRYEPIDTPIFQPYTQGTNLLGYDSNGLPIDLVVTAPRKYVARYDSDGNPVYTTDINLSMGYTTLPQTEEETRRKAARTEIKNRRSGELTGTARSLSDMAVASIGSALAPLALQPLISGTWPTINAALPSLAKAEIGGRTVDLVTRAFTPYSSWSDGIGSLVQTATGWNPNDHPLGRMVTDLSNPGYWNPYGVTDRVVNAVGSKVIYPAEEAVTTLIDNGTLYDPYTTFRGRLGNYGDNIFTDVYGTLARRWGLPDKARIPADAIRKITEPVRVEEGLVDLTGEKTYLGNPHVNVSLDRPVVSHVHGWDGADTYVTSTHDFLVQTPQSLISIEPSDMFANGTKVTANPRKVTLISGDTEVLRMARKSGLQTLSSPKLRRMYNDAYSRYQQDRLSISHPKKEKYWLDYATEVQRLQSQRGMPTLADFLLLEQQTGLSSGVAPIWEYYNAIRQIEKMLNANISDIVNGKVTQYVYPNGRVVDWSKAGEELELLKRAKYNHVFYDPASHAEMDWRTLNGLK